VGGLSPQPLELHGCKKRDDEVKFSNDVDECMMMNSIVQLGEWVRGYAIIEFVSGITSAWEWIWEARQPCENDSSKSFF
jgi:hypothetical protein